jgi:hypothetical protein
MPPPAGDRAPRLRGAVRPMRRAAWAVEERVIWAGADAARAAADAALWPFQRIAWAIERGLIWPLQDALAGWSQPARGAAATGLAAAALAAGAAGALIGTPAEGPAPATSAQLAAPIEAVPTAASAPTPAAAPAVEGPVLKGATPTFESATPASSADADTAAASAAPAAAEESPAKPADAKPVPGQREAVAVATRFAEAFTLYEIGEGGPAVRRTFAQTSSPTLAKALRERPPRQPAGVEVPKARVLNVVPGPSQGDRITMSASLLRVGSTSELRLDLRRTDSQWLVTDVRG